MKKRILTGLCLSLCLSISVFSQTVAPSPTPTRQRVVNTNPVYSPTPLPKVVVVTDNLPSPTPTPFPKPTAAPTVVQNPTPVNTPNTSIQTFPQVYTSFTTLKLGEIKNKLAEAKREMFARPIATALTSSILPMEFVRIAFYDYDTKQIDYVVMTKDSFLARGATYATTTSKAKPVNVYIIRANGVNTPVTITGQNNKAHLPLMVQYPVIRDGRFIETAYYMSTHPGLVTPEVINAGKLYMRNTLDVARDKLREKGIFITPQVADIAERLAIVEHIDHQRFWTENHLQLFNEVYALYALNEGQTYRYAVSSAGAGGMVQMIPSTYYMIRQRYYNVGLIPDFVEGMRNHANAAQAMLLYMQMTWTDLLASQTVFEAVQSGIATPAELMSAGYNSNPAKLPGYIKRGGANWRNLIPRETKIYLQINQSMDRFVPLNAPRTK
ncbi:MAG: hypothetical protein ABWZ66_02680 [Pyrinomonadaceae bacterium]